MVAGLKFLSKKAFNPQNLSNQKRVWEREQQEKQEARRTKERNDQLKREREDEELAKARGDTLRLGFMYAAPPGLETKKNSGDSANDNNQSNVHYEDGNHQRVEASGAALERQPGDDDAAAAFRALFAAPPTDDSTLGAETHGSRQHLSSFGTVLHGTSYDPRDNQPDKFTKPNISALEKAVGRKKDGQALTLDEQIQRFPALANAPRAKGLSSSDIGVNFKPLGSQIRNVKCMVCGVWGHSRGDRECKLSGWNPFESTAQQSSITNETAPPVHVDNAKATHKRSSESKSARHSDTSSNDSSEDSYSRHRKKRSKRSHDQKSRRTHRRERRREKRRSEFPHRSEKRSSRGVDERDRRR